MIKYKFQKVMPTGSKLLSGELKQWSKENWLYDWAQEKEISILDLGCGYPIHLISLCEKANVKKICGVDIENEKNISIIHSRRNGNTVHSFYEIYQQSNKLNLIEFDKFQSQIVNSIYFETDIKDFLDENIESFDLIISSLSMHFLSKDEFGTYLHKFLKCLKTGGKFYILIQDKRKNFEFSDDHWSGDLIFIESVFSITKALGDFGVILDGELKPFQFEFQNFAISHS